MAYKVALTAKAEEDFKKLDKTIQKQVFKYLTKIESREDPHSLGEQLQDNLSHLWKYRVGNYRLIAEIIDDKFIVLMILIAHRRDVYKKAKKRT